MWFGVSYLILQDSLACKMGDLRVPLSEMPARIWGDYTWKAPPFMVSSQEMFAIIMVMIAAAVAFVVAVLVVLIAITPSGPCLPLHIISSVSFSHSMQAPG